MKVIIDISLLGQGFYHPKSRTGVFRVVENLAQFMPKFDSELEVLFAENNDLSASMGYAVKYLKSTDFQYVNLVSEINIIKKQNLVLLKFKHNSLIHKGLRKIFSRFNGKELTLRDDLLSSTNIYHSPFHQIPEQINGYKKIKKVITIHDLIPIKYPQYFQDNHNSDVHKIIASLGQDTHVICISESTKNDVLEITKLPEEQVSIVPLAASKEVFYPVRDCVLRNQVLSKYKINTPYLLSVSTLEPRKNLSKLIQCFSRIVVQEKIEDLSLVLVGTKGWDFEKILLDSKINPDLAKRIIFTGYVPDEDLAALYSAAISFVYLSLYEGFGLPPLEAMQCGTPIICSNTSSLPEVVGQGGLLVSPTNDDIICQTILEVIKNEQLRSELSNRAIKQSKLFSWDKFSEKTYDVYKKIS
jgi:glycosyltransferase involved in cell wall biosynthesis